MSRILCVSLYVSQQTWEKVKDDIRWQPGTSSVNGTQGLELGSLNEFQGPLIQFKYHVRQMALQAQKAKEWEVVSVMSRLLSECVLLGIYSYIVLRNV